MVLLFFLIAVFAILCIARYNEDDRLFWKLFVSFTAAFMITTITARIISSNDQTKDDATTKVYPTQLQNSSLDQMCLFKDALNFATVKDVTDPVAVSKEKPNFASISFDLQKIWRGIRDQPPQCLISLNIRSPGSEVGILDDS